MNCTSVYLIYSVSDPEFQEYGRIVRGYSVEEILRVLHTKECPEDAVVYRASDEELENLGEAKVIQRELYGQMPVNEWQYSCKDSRSR